MTRSTAHSPRTRALAVRDARFLIVGGASLVGSATAELLLAEGPAGVTTLDNFFQSSTEAIKHLGLHAARHGIRLVLEIHMNTLHDTVASTARLLDMIGLDNVMANPDPGNMFATSTAERNPEALNRLEGRIGYFHFKNCQAIAGAYDFSVKLADGHIDIYKWLSKLVAIGYDDRVCIEYCGTGDPHEAARHDIAYLRESLGWIRR